MMHDSFIFKALPYFVAIIFVLGLVSVVIQYVAVGVVGQHVWAACGDNPGRCIGQFLKEIEEGKK